MKFGGEERVRAMPDTLPEKLPEHLPLNHASGCTTNLGIIGAQCNCGAFDQWADDDYQFTQALNEIKRRKETINILIETGEKKSAHITEVYTQLASANKRIEELEKGFIEWIESLPIPMDLTLLHPSEIEFFNKMADTLWKFSDKAKIEQLESEVARLEKQSSPEHIKWEREMERRILLYIREIGIVNRAMTKKSNLIKDLRAEVARLTEAQRVRLEYIATLEIEKAQLEDEKAQLRGKLQDKQEQLVQVEKNTKDMVGYLLTQWEEAGKIMDGYRAKLEQAEANALTEEEAKFITSIHFPCYYASDAKLSESILAKLGGK
jgi:hypothetical protein